MTKYVLQSGGVGNYPEKAKKFMAEVVKGLGNKPNILFCLFPQPREYWEERFEGYKNFYTSVSPDGVKPQFVMAMPKDFIEQIRNCDILMMTGGDDHLAQYWLKQFDIPNIWKGKVISGNSGSSQALSAAYWTCDWRECGNGLAVLPLKFLAHYKSPTYGVDDPRGPIDWTRAYKDLETYGDNLPIYALEEGDFVVIEQ